MTIIALTAISWIPPSLASAFPSKYISILLINSPCNSCSKWYYLSPIVFPSLINSLTLYMIPVLPLLSSSLESATTFSSCIVSISESILSICSELSTLIYSWMTSTFCETWSHIYSISLKLSLQSSMLWYFFL